MIIFYQTKTKFTNTGDALINRSLIDLLRNYGNIIANDRIPVNFLNELGIRKTEELKNNSKYNFTISTILFAIRAIFSNDKVYIFSGLGHNYGGSYKKIIRNLISGLLFPVLRCLGVKIVRIGISIGPITKLLAVSEVFRSLFINHYLVRDTESLKLCQSIGIKKADLCPDLSWAYNPIFTKGVKEKIITVNLRNSTLDEFVYEDYISKLFNNLSVILDRMIEKLGKETKIQIVYQVSEDKEFSKVIYNKYKDKYHLYFNEDQLTLETAPLYYGSSLFTISNRMHSLLLCYKYDSLSIPLIDKEEHVKITSTFKDANLEGLIQDINNINLDMIDILIEQREAYLRALKQIELNNSNEIERVINSILCR